MALKGHKPDLTFYILSGHWGEQFDLHMPHYATRQTGEQGANEKALWLRVVTTLTE